MTLVRTPGTAARVEHILETGKPLRQLEPFPNRREPAHADLPRPA